MLSAALFMSACADPSANKPKAQVSENRNDATNTAAPQTGTSGLNVLDGYKPAGTELTISPETSKVEFTGSKVTGKHDGGFKKFMGVIDLVGDKPETSKVLFEIEMNSVFTDTDGVTKHLQTADFFDVEKYPKASFSSTSITALPNGADNYSVTGDMTIHGTKRSITFPATITNTTDLIAVTAEFSINRKDFGIAYAGKTDDLIRDDVVLRLDLKAPKKK